MTALTIDELEILTPDQLGGLLIAEVRRDSPDIQYIQDIIAVGCPIDSIDEWNKTALHYAARYRKLEIVEYLISNGAQLDARVIEVLTAWNMGDMAIKKIKELYSRSLNHD